MVSGSYERIISKVTANVCLDDFPADTIARNEVFVLTLRAPLISKTASHFCFCLFQETVSSINVIIGNGSKWPNEVRENQEEPTGPEEGGGRWSLLGRWGVDLRGRRNSTKYSSMRQRPETPRLRNKANPTFG